MEEYDLIIIGQGSGGFAAAMKANDLGLKTVMVGGNATPGTLIGGTCVNVGCLPSKHLITVGNSFYHTANNSFRGIKYEKGKLNFKKVIAQKNELVEKFRKEKYTDVLDYLTNVSYIAGKGKFVSKNEVQIGKKIIKGKKFLIATGARSNIIKLQGMEEIDYLTNETIMELKDLPKSLVVIGGRAVGLEFAQMFSHFGTKVTVLQRSDRIMPDGEPELSNGLRQYLEEEGIVIHTRMKINKVSKKGKNKLVNITVSDKTFDVEGEHILFATGRKPNTEDLGLDSVGVKTDKRGFIQVNDEMQTSAPNVWAAGDVIGNPMLETLAAKAGSTAIKNAFTKEKKKINLKEIPAVTFTYPELATVGLTDAETQNQGIKCACGTIPFTLVAKAHIIGDTRGLIKMVVNNKTKVIQGVHILSPHASELIHEATLIVKNKLTIDDVIDTVHVFPTLSEAIKHSAQSFYRDVSKASCCIE